MVVSRSSRQRVPCVRSISFLTPLSSDVAIATIIGERSPNHERQRAWCVLCARACPTRAASPCPKVRDAVPADHSSIACHCMFVFEFHKRVCPMQSDSAGDEFIRVECAAARRAYRSCNHRRRHMPSPEPRVPTPPTSSASHMRCPRCSCPTLFNRLDRLRHCRRARRSEHVRRRIQQREHSA